jgi:antitoxin component YwqK of YwqJK toxin-antitoxin module
MDNIDEIKEKIIKHAKEKHILYKIKEVESCNTWNELKVSIANNYWWCINENTDIPNGYYKSNKYEFTLVNSQLHGEYKSWHDNGQLWQECFYKEGKKNGEYKQWHPNGQLFGHWFYKNDKFNGKYKQWWENGQLWEECIYKDGKFDGLHLIYDKNGTLMISSEGRKDSHDGFSYETYRKEYHNNGKIKYEGNIYYIFYDGVCFSSGPTKGEHKYYDENGTLMKKTVIKW